MLYQICDLDFFQLVFCLFCSLNSVFEKDKFLILMKSGDHIFPDMDHTLVLYQGNLCSSQGHKHFCLLLRDISELETDLPKTSELYFCRLKSKSHPFWCGLKKRLPGRDVFSVLPSRYFQLQISWHRHFLINYLSLMPLNMFYIPLIINIVLSLWNGCQKTWVWITTLVIRWSMMLGFLEFWVFIFE